MVSTATAQNIVCTTAENRYFDGVAALSNSLIAAGFAGTIVVGYRGDPPHWFRGSPSGIYTVTPAVQLELVPVSAGWHLNNCKPLLMEQILYRTHPSTETLYYFDTDIVVTHPWSDFVRWAQNGIVMALDVAHTNMPPDHVYRYAWRELAARQGRQCRPICGYVNGGCIGVSRAHAEFVVVWRSLMEELEREGADMLRMKNVHDRPEYSRMDQDILNATVMATDFPLALFGPEAMGVFPYNGEVMPHAMWGSKPWRSNYIISALRGFPPMRSHRAYWRYATGPIKPFGKLTLRRKRLELAVAHAIGLVHRRSMREV